MCPGGEKKKKEKEKREQERAELIIFQSTAEVSGLRVWDLPDQQTWFQKFHIQNIRALFPAKNSWYTSRQPGG